MIKKITSALCILIFSFILVAEKTLEQKIIELKNKLKTVEAEEKVDILNDLAEKNRSISPTNSLEYIKEAFEISRKIKYKKGEAQAYYNKSFCFNTLGDNAKALELAEESLKIREEIDDKRGIAASLNCIGGVYCDLGNFNKSLEYRFKSMKIAEKIGDKRELANSLNNIGVVYSDLGNFDKSLEYHFKSLKIAEEIGNNEGIANSLNNIGVVYSDLSKYQKALEYHIKSLKIREQIGTKKGISASLANIAIGYFRLNKYEMALEYRLKSLKLSEEIKDKKEIANSLNIIGTIYLYLTQYQKSLDYYLKSLKGYEEIGNKQGIAGTFVNIGTIYGQLENYNKSLEYFQKSLGKFNEISDKQGVALSLISIGKAYLQLTQYEKSLEYSQKSLMAYEEVGEKLGVVNSMMQIGVLNTKLKQYNKGKKFLENGLQLAKKIQSKDSIRKSYEFLSELYLAMEDLKKTYKYYKLFHELDKEIYNENSSKKIAEMQARYETEKKEQKIKDLEKDKKIQQLILSRSRTVRNAFIISFILALVILILLFKKYLYLFSFWKKRVYVGQFIIQEKIGTGGMGTIFRAHSIKNKSTTAAIKILKEELFDSKESRKRFEHEAAIIDQLNHDHIVKIKERGQYQDKMYITMELLHGLTLNEKLEQEGKMDIGIAIHIMRQITETLAFIHSRGVIHRDLKPSNIMLINKNDDPNFVKLLDFGIAKSEKMTELTKKGDIVGTPQYMAPEQFKGSNFITSASDIYSLSVIFYEMLTGIPVFNGEQEEVIDKIRNSLPVPPKDYRNEIPMKLNQLILEMLEKNPKNRPAIDILKKTLIEIR